MDTASIKGFGAYNKVLQNNRQIVPSQSNQPTMILRQGDNLEIIQDNITATPTFDKFLDQAVYSEIAKIKSSGKKIDNFLSLTKNEEEGASVDLVGLVSSVNESEIALQTIVSVREKLVGAYQEIMKMPL